MRLSVRPNPHESKLRSAPKPGTASGPRVLVLAEGFREGRTGGQRLWAALVDWWTTHGIEVVTEEQAPIHRQLIDRPLLLAVRNLLVFGGFHRGVVIADQSDAGRLSLLLRRLRRRDDVRIVMVVHHLRQEFRYAHPLYVRILRWNETSLVRSADRIVVHTQIEAQRVVERGVAQARVTIVPVGVPNTGARVTIRELDGTDPLRLLWVGGDFLRKDLPTMLRAIAVSPAPRPRLTVVGEPHDSGTGRRARTMVQELGVEDCVEFQGRVSQDALDELWRTHDAFVIPSLHEGHGTALDEALVRGMPVLASNLPVFRERLTDNEVLFAPAGDTGAISTALAQLRDPERRRRLSEAGLLRASRFPSWESTLRAYELVIREEDSELSRRRSERS